MSLDAHKQANPGYLDYIDAGLRNGVSAFQTLRMLREDGLAIRTQDFYAAWRARRRHYIMSGLAARTAKGEGNHAAN